MFVYIGNTRKIVKIFMLWAITLANLDYLRDNNPQHVSIS